MNNILKWNKDYLQDLVNIHLHGNRKTLGSSQRKREGIGEKVVNDKNN